MDIMNPTAKDVQELKAKGLTFPRAAEYSLGYQQVVAEEELAALMERVAAAKAKGECLSLNDQIAWDQAFKNGWIIPKAEPSARELIETGLHQAELDRQGKAVLVLNELTRLTQELEAAVKQPKWHDFPGKVEAAKKARELRAQFETAAKDVAVKLGHLTDLEYRDLAHEHIGALRARLAAKFEE